MADESSLRLVVCFEIPVNLLVVVLKADPFVDQAEDLAEEGHFLALAVHDDVLVADLDGLLAELVQDLQVGDGENPQLLFVGSELAELDYGESAHGDGKSPFLEAKLLELKIRVADVGKVFLGLGIVELSLEDFLQVGLDLADIDADLFLTAGLLVGLGFTVDVEDDFPLSIPIFTTSWKKCSKSATTMLMEALAIRKMNFICSKLSLSDIE